jgi:N-terminal domain of unknown function (DUF4140)
VRKAYFASTTKSVDTGTGKLKAKAHTKYTDDNSLLHTVGAHALLLVLALITLHIAVYLLQHHKAVYYQIVASSTLHCILDARTPRTQFGGFTSLFLGAALSMASTQIERVIQAADAPISEVTMFKCNRAEVTRRLTVDLEAGGHFVIKLQGLPSGIEGTSVGASAQGLCALHRVNYLEAKQEIEREPVEELRAELSELKKHDAALAAESARSKQLRQYLDTYASTTMATTATSSPEDPSRPAGLQTVREVLAFTQEHTAGADNDVARLDERREIIGEQMAAVKARLAAAEQTEGAASSSKLVRQVVVSCITHC